MKQPLLIALFLIALLLSAVAPAAAQGEKPAADAKAPPAAAPRQGPTDPAELEAFLDELIPRQLAENHIAGAAVSVVRDGRVLLAKGYGYADVATGAPVDPAQTAFLIGSVGKLFTWTAVMQLVEQGRLDLDADVNDYLDFPIPDTYPQPITLRHLLTHTAGFEDLYFEYLTLDPAKRMSEREWMSTHLPARVRPPGAAAAYSNYGTQLAGYIVARVSGLPYQQYVQTRILDPLGMAHSTAESPAPAALPQAVGYLTVDGEYQPAPTFYGQPAMFPAGAHGSTAADMARFMLALLADGDASDEGRILSATTAARMLDTLYAPDPRLRGTAYGLFDISDNGRRTLGHDGDTLGFKTLLFLMPAERLGVYVSYNGEEADDLTRQHFGFQRAFFDHYYPAPAVEPIAPPADFAGRAGRFVGSYRMARRAHTSMEKFRSLYPDIAISDPGDGTLTLGTPWGEWRYVEAGPLYFRQVDGPAALVFRENGKGRITHLFVDMAPQFAFERAQWYELPAFNMGLVAACAAVFLSAVLVAAARLVRGRRAGQGATSAAGGARAAAWLLLALGVVNLLFLGGIFLWGEANLTPLFGITPAFRAVLALGVVSAGLAAAALVYTALAWRDGNWGVAGRAYYTLVAVAAVAFVWFLDFWNLLGWRF